MIWANLRSAGTARAPVSGAIVRELQDHSRAFSGIAGIWTLTRTIRSDHPEQLKAALVTVNFFDVLGVKAQRGHTFRRSEEGTSATLLSNSLFQRRFAGNGSLLGRSLPLQNESNTLVGVLPARFLLHFAPDANVPPEVQIFSPFPADVYGGRDQYFIRVIGRLKSGVSFAQAQQDIDRAAKEIRAQYAEYEREELQFAITGMQADAVRDIRPALQALLAGAVFILLLCCVNVAALLVARAGHRRKEIALRLALGASQGRLLRQLLTESILLCTIGGFLGFTFGWIGFRGLLAIRPERLAYLDDSGLQGAMLTFAVMASLSSAVLFGLAPSVESFRMDFVTTLRAQAKSWFTRLHRRSGHALVVGEVALAFVLVTAATLMARTLSHLQRVQPGFEPRSLLTFQVGGLPFHEVSAWELRLAALPGVASAGATSHLPFDTDIPNWYGPYRPEGATTTPGATFISDLRCVTPAYFTAMGARLTAGRYFNEQDRTHSQAVVVVDDVAARTAWPGQTALGKKIEVEHITEAGFRPISSVVVGVVGHVYSHSLTKVVRGQIYLPYEQSPRNPLTFVLRTKVLPLSLVPTIQQMLHETSKAAAMGKVQLMNDYVTREISPSQFVAVLAWAFAGLAVMLAGGGVYGVLHYQISQRLPELGVRMALGATAAELVRQVFRESLVLIAIGLTVGIAGAFLVSGWLAAMVYGVSPRDPLSYAVAAFLLPTAVLAGSLPPALLAGRVNPAEMIRTDSF